MKYVILGSGPSIEKYEPAGADVVISCHFAISEDTTHLCSNHLREYGWQPIPTISAVKHRMVKYNSLKSYPKHLLWQPATEEANWETPSTVCVEGLCETQSWGRQVHLLTQRVVKTDSGLSIILKLKSTNR